MATRLIGSAWPRSTRFPPNYFRRHREERQRRGDPFFYEILDCRVAHEWLLAMTGTVWIAVKGKARNQILAIGITAA
jgi:hypothetical protein